MGFTLASVQMRVLYIVRVRQLFPSETIYNMRYIKIVFVVWEVLTNQYEVVGPTSASLFVFEPLRLLSPPSYY